MPIYVTITITLTMTTDATDTSARRPRPGTLLVAATGGLPPTSTERHLQPLAIYNSSPTIARGGGGCIRRRRRRCSGRRSRLASSLTLTSTTRTTALRISSPSVSSLPITRQQRMAVLRPPHIRTRRSTSALGVVSCGATSTIGNRKQRRLPRSVAA